MLCCQIAAPVWLELEFVRMFFKLGNGLCVAYAFERCLYNVAECVDYARLDSFVEELHVLAAFCECPVEKIFDELFLNVHVIVEIEECHLRLTHPELCEVACCV